MHIRCPDCHKANEIVEDSSFKDVSCPSCGSHFNLVGGDAPTESGLAKPCYLGHFELIEQLGVGNFGTVWKGYSRVRRGGSWSGPAACCRSAFRHLHQPQHRSDNAQGFRVAAVP
ncbi:MAG: hypothetical protein ACYC6N_24470 [Pirellulaceae bacterium]